MSPATLRRFTRPMAAPAPDVEHCDICGVAVGSRHGHLVELDQRSLRCACRACYLLFTADGAGGRRFRAVPERYLTDPAHPLTAADWDELQIPVTPVFLFTNSDLGRVVACYPSPAGATECLLDLDSWERLRQTRPLLATPADDVEAIYVTRGRAQPESGFDGGEHGPSRSGRAQPESGFDGGEHGLTGSPWPEAFLVPIDACYGLVGAVRLRWRGLDGGDEVRRTLAEFTDDLRARSRSLTTRQV